MNPMLNIDVAKAIRDDRLRAADQARLAALVKDGQPPRPPSRHSVLLFLGAAWRSLRRGSNKHHLRSDPFQPCAEHVE